MSKNISDLSGRKGLNQNLFEKVSEAASGKKLDNYDVEKLSEDFLVGKANIVGTATFYDFLKPENQGKKIYVCNGSACLTAGTQNVLKDKISKHFSDEETGEMCCLGRCHENSAFNINGKNYSGNDIENIDNIIKSNTLTNEKYNVSSSGIKILTSQCKPTQKYYEILKKCLEKKPEELLTELKESKLRGRGGAGFPIWFKLDTCMKENSPVKYIVCNADEGDPGAYSDRYILENQTHLLLLGMLIAGYIVNATDGVIYIRAEYPESVQSVEKAVEELKNLKITGNNIFNSNFSFNFKIIKAQGAYICGEETALLSSIEGQRPEVRVRPPYPTQFGLFNKPTIVNNVETLANLPFIFENGGKTFAGIGTEKTSGTKLVSLDGWFNNPGIYEVEMGTPLQNVVYTLGGGFKKPVKALHIGGPLGGLVPVNKINDLTVDFESFSQNGFLLGHASVVCIPEDFKLIEYINHLFKFTAHESCGKCFPCRLGSIRGWEMIEKSINNNYKIDYTLMDDLLETMEKASLCALGGGLPLPVKNALKYFKTELSPYFINFND
ncbi:MAG: NAD(P)H-dependent oxidoreductase subunit E [Bacteroidetes bacterium]|nr:NAD(P)H-dependent oxidoreductase subunit E [Bacteroidota bacterium]